MKRLLAMIIISIMAAMPAMAQTTPAPAPSGGPPGMTSTEKNAQLALEKAGYSQVTDVKSGPRGVAAKAVKNGKPVSVVVDPMGKIEELPPAK
ncbi:hypothetical protein [Vineibacter terrae]|uniref:hypothetical protein n=1 Tax=Vineibacter terrae TaxID=2586908 RepID=UPI002E366023|nr:hypothetical protein [Vineibacter terrae]HEX2890437.1 hypothetical protein [Vineibacter terrae]